MESAASLAELQAEASCPICLDYLRDPVTIECGHTFCHSCIHQRWEDLPGTFPCPACLYHCPDKNLKRNTQLCHIIEVVKQIPTTGNERKLQEEKPLCGKHNEVLTLFCDSTEEMLCPHCKVPLDHQDQSLIPIEEAAASCRKKLKRYIRALLVEVEDAETEYENQVAKEFEVQKKVEKWRKELQYECKELKCSLQIEHSVFNAGLLIEEKDVEEKLTENGRQISNHMFMLNKFLSEIAEKYLQTDVDLLTGIEDIHNRYEKLETPAVFSYKLKKESCNLPPHYLGLYKMISTFQVDLTLDPETAHPSLIISRDRKSVTYRTPDGLPNPQALTSYPAVLSSEGFDAGRHFWQVEVRGTGEWSLGVCKESCLINSLISPSPSNSCRHIDLCASICGTCPRGHIMRVGIFLDYELGDVSFYNLNNGSYLYGFSGKFKEKLMPYFSSAPSSKSLTFIIRDE
ncbi:PREDICTED: tripartite motif-containing protein 60 [Myotis davidii]|uniref:Tripartite motif-containing protein 60 n=1 Tax=Myotis davidii TaxID=225400 RepID=L5LEN9_MYODS|nr:PREDICTED: tripartite motif-containing protein 60 [Myotis davidii]ELK24672.1 Tripartite motif-containing protein 60 [Myotis davidii]